MVLGERLLPSSSRAAKLSLPYVRSRYLAIVPAPWKESRFIGLYAGQEQEGKNRRTSVPADSSSIPNARTIVRVGTKPCSRRASTPTLPTRQPNTPPVSLMDVLTISRLRLLCHRMTLGPRSRCLRIPPFSATQSSTKANSRITVIVTRVRWVFPL